MLLWLLPLVVLVPAVWLVAHVALVARCWSDEALTPRERWVLLVFPPILAWRVGKSWHVVLWACLIVVYAALRIALALR